MIFCKRLQIAIIQLQKNKKIYLIQYIIMKKEQLIILVVVGVVIMLYLKNKNKLF